MSEPVNPIGITTALSRIADIKQREDSNLKAREKGEYEIIRVEKSLIPKGATLVEAYETEHEIIVIGFPVNDDHNCDALGCSSLSHVAYRFQKGQP